MVDGRLRELERSAAIGSTEDRAAWLRARIRAGELARERIELAAYAGSLVARGVIEIPGPGFPRCFPECGEDPEWGPCEDCDFSIWLTGLARWGRECQIRAPVAAARLVLARMPRLHGPFSDPHMQARSIALEQRHSLACSAIEAAERWCVCPCGEHQEACAKTALETALQLGRSDHWAVIPASIVKWPGGNDGPGGTALLTRLIHQGARIATEPEIRYHISKELISWALGNDPILSRVNIAPSAMNSAL